MTDLSAQRQAFEARMKPMPSGCIEWTGNIDGSGYGRFCFQRKITLAHRAAWTLFRGPIPDGMCLLHKCDNPPCVNPDHLFLGDRGDNARDMSAKQRQWVQKNPAGRPVCPIELKPRGEGHGMSKLSEADVLSIRRKASTGALGKDLAAEFGCARSLISAIVLGQIWQHVGGPIRTSKTKEKSND
jgi:hypothetical protein